MHAELDHIRTSGRRLHECDRDYMVRRGGGRMYYPSRLPRGVRPFGHRPYGSETLVPSPLLLMVNVPEVVEL